MGLRGVKFEVKMLGWSSKYFSDMSWLVVRANIVFCVHYYIFDKENC